MSNDQMQPNRYLRWHHARTLVSRIQSHLQAGGTVVVGTYTRATAYKPKHVGMFKATKSGAYVQRGKRWDCIDHCGFRFV